MAYTLAISDGRKRIVMDQVFSVEIEGFRIRIWQHRSAKTNPLPIEVCTFVDRDRDIEMERIDDDVPLGWVHRQLQEVA